MNTISNYILLLYTVVSLTSFSYADYRIIGGTPAENLSAPYQVSLQNNLGAHVCGGAVISELAVISAAHCFVNAFPENITIIVGTNDLTKQGNVYNSSKIIIHEEYNKESKENDIALLFSAKKIIFTVAVKPISILSRFIEAGEILRFTGFGKTNLVIDSPSFILQTIYFKAFDMETCHYAYRNIRKLFDSQLCTFNKIDEGSCHGDSGGPLVLDSGIVGVSSFGVPCGVGYPDVFTRVSDYVDWIVKNDPDAHVENSGNIEIIPSYLIIICGIINLHKFVR